MTAGLGLASTAAGRLGAVRFGAVGADEKRRRSGSRFRPSSSALSVPTAGAASLPVPDAALSGIGSASASGESMEGRAAAETGGSIDGESWGGLEAAPSGAADGVANPGARASAAGANWRRGRDTTAMMTTSMAKPRPTRSREGQASVVAPTQRATARIRSDGFARTDALSMRVSTRSGTDAARPHLRIGESAAAISRAEEKRLPRSGGSLSGTSDRSPLARARASKAERASPYRSARRDQSAIFPRRAGLPVKHSNAMMASAHRSTL